MTLTLRPLPPPTIICWVCAATYKDPGGDDSAWRCRKCEAVLTRDEEQTPRLTELQE